MRAPRSAAKRPAPGNRRPVPPGSDGSDRSSQPHDPKCTASRSDLARRLRLIVITDRALAAPRDLLDVTTEALRAGAPAVQLREKHLPPGEVTPVARRLRAAVHAAGALFFVNDRLDLALAVGADGVHLGPEDLPVSAARRMAPPGFLIGYSADQPAAAAAAIDAGADYVGCGAVFATRAKAEAGDAIGLSRLAAVVRSADAPVVGIGGITADRAPAILGTGAAGIAVVSAVMGARNPAKAVRALLQAAPLQSRKPKT